MNVSKLAEFLEDGDGSLSSTRLAFLLWAIGVLVVWIIASVEKKTLQPIDSSVTTVLGILMTGKVVQKFGEAKSPSLAQTPPQNP